MAFPRQIQADGHTYRVISRVTLIDNTYIEFMPLGTVGYEVDHQSTTTYHIYIVWDPSNPSYENLANGCYSATRFSREPARSTDASTESKWCTCTYGNHKTIWCGIGPAAEEIDVCVSCHKEVSYFSSRK